MTCAASLRHSSFCLNAYMRVLCVGFGFSEGLYAWDDPESDGDDTTSPHVRPSETVCTLSLSVYISHACVSAFSLVRYFWMNMEKFMRQFLTLCDIFGVACVISNQV